MFVTTPTCLENIRFIFFFPSIFPGICETQPIPPRTCDGFLYNLVLPITTSPGRKLDRTFIHDDTYIKLRIYKISDKKYSKHVDCFICLLGSNLYSRSRGYACGVRYTCTNNLILGKPNKGRLPVPNRHFSHLV